MYEPTTAHALASSSSTATRSMLLHPEPPDEPLPELLGAYDPAFLRRVYPFLSWWVDRYFRSEIIGAEHLSDRPGLIVGTHNGGMGTPDFYTLLVAFWRRLGIEAPLYSMAHKAVFSVPLFRTLIAKAGVIPATPGNAKMTLRAGFPLLVYPGGDVDALKPFSERHRITFAGRRGFIRTALREQVPITPVVSVGAHETLFVLNDGRKLARRLGFDRWLRVKSVPIVLSFPLGLTIAGFPSIPLPSKVRLQVLPPIVLDEGPEAADDPTIVARCYAHVVATM
ncbi:MAG: acyltransferase family protein, partial [Deltaproteobacteria bacterium]|nr:acyltransferase family protein [Deltaproteobacteria bacterium]